MASTITHLDDHSIRFTAGEGVTLTTVKLYEYEIGGYWNQIEDNDADTLTDGGTIDYSLSQDNLYRIEISYNDGSARIKQFDYLVTDDLQTYIQTTLETVFCGCNELTKCKQKDYYKANTLLTFIAGAFAYAYDNRDNSTSTNVTTVQADVTMINDRLDSFYSNCEFKGCSSNTCNCIG